MLEKTINEDLKKAMKQGDKTRVSVIRMLISEAKNKKIALQSGDLDDREMTGIIQKMVRRHKESIEKFKEGGREDLVDKETREMSVLEEYLPEPMSVEELRGIVKDVISAEGASSVKDMGKVIGEVMARAEGRADGKMVSGMVKEELS